MPILTSLGSSVARGYGFGVADFKVTIAGDQTDLNLRTYAVASGWAGASQLRVTVNGGVYIKASSTGAVAMTVSGSFPAGLLLTNNGTILGYGGAGGNGGNGDPPTKPGSAGSAGGTGLSVSSAIKITNNGTVAGGGGGGGGGAGLNAGDWYGGGGGGGGASYGSYGAAGQGSGPGTGKASPGTTGGLTTGGSGGGIAPGGAGGAGGAGGNLGANGTAGSNTSQASGGSGGGAGYYVVGSSNVTWLVTGTRLGNAA